jgi:hypothetical protein
MSVRAFTKFIASLSLFACASVFAAPVTIDVTGIQSTGERGDPNNSVFRLDVGAYAHLVSVGYDVTITAVTPSYLSEMFVAFTDSAGFGTQFNPSDVEDSGTASSSGFASLVNLGLDFTVGADGILMLEFFEAFQDPVTPNGVWNAGTITFFFDDVTTPPGGSTPEPDSVLLLGAGLAALGYASRRRRAASV